ncbi:MAG: 23S rRNA (pseudouridine(1915)-N(3))-methyltransferase RlmH [Candidatus Coatesbacteria bacterium]|nr:23S rRNA (pseudouridine(1915)-N(3))-methyltransferase RlmH [Candidatus Coatesbacteria bacterium]
MKITVYSSNKLKSHFLKLVEDYKERISFHWQIERRYINPSRHDLLIKQISVKSLFFILDEKGKIYDNQELAGIWNQFINGGGKEVFLFIGGSYGYNDNWQMNHPDNLWSLSKLTFPHMLAEVILFEQLYRTQCLIKNHPYPH